MQIPMLIVALTVLAAVSGALHIGAEYAGARRGIYVFKPLTVLLIIGIAVAGESSLYKYLILAGLLCSLAGDIFLMLPKDRFIPGLISFLVAHLFYIAAFTLDSGRTPSLLTALPLLIYGGVMLRMLFPSLGKMKAPVIVYMLVILLMVWQASNRYASAGVPGSGLAFAGATLFAVSDSLLASNRFRRPFRSAQLLILSSYFAAQWSIALSVELRSP
jgi:uncharacterized membrane protein YhhN